MRLRTRKIKQNNQEFLLGVFKMAKLKTFVKYTERLITGYDDDDMPLYNDEVQRKLNNAKVTRIADYLIHDPESLFPTNILLAVPNGIIDEIDEGESNVDLFLNDIVETEINKDNGKPFITIIDGQHRMKGIELAIQRLTNLISNSGTIDEKDKDLENPKAILSNLNNLELVVSFFINPTPEYQAMLFSIINRTQTKVPEDLVYSLFGLSETETAPKSVLSMVLALNSNSKSPFHDRIRLAGAKYKKGESPPFSQSMMVKSILKFLTRFPRDFEIERNKERKYFIQHPNNELPFRELYGQDDDSEILKILLSFFNAVKSTFIKRNNNSYWDFENNSNKPNNVLQTTVGYEALMLLLKDILLKEKNKNKIKSKSFYEELLDNAKRLPFEDKEKYPFTSVTRTNFYNDLKDKLNDFFNNT